mmetsp:Transcript_129569/g.361016  ORF Transcript_129569/g.361016 Transcript_129569/m.361016 type:complete len:589 (-) Transcript_129569:96-1862(-)
MTLVLAAMDEGSSTSPASRRVEEPEPEMQYVDEGSGKDRSAATPEELQLDQVVAKRVEVALKELRRELRGELRRELGELRAQVERQATRLEGLAGSGPDGENPSHCKQHQELEKPSGKLECQAHRPERLGSSDSEELSQFVGSPSAAALQSQMERLAGELAQKAARAEALTSAQAEELRRLTAAVARKADSDGVPTAGQWQQLAEAVLEKADRSEVPTLDQVKQLVTSVMGTGKDKDNSQASPCLLANSTPTPMVKRVTSKEANGCLIQRRPSGEDSRQGLPEVARRTSVPDLSARHLAAHAGPNSVVVKRLVRRVMITAVATMLLLSIMFVVVIEDKTVQFTRLGESVVAGDWKIDKLSEEISRKPNRDEVPSIESVENKLQHLTEGLGRKAETADVPTRTQVEQLVQRATEGVGAKALRLSGAEKVPKVLEYWGSVCEAGRACAAEAGGFRRGSLKYRLSYRVTPGMHDELLPVMQPRLAWVPVNLSDTAPFDVDAQYRLLPRDHDHLGELGFLDATLLSPGGLHFWAGTSQGSRHCRVSAGRKAACELCRPGAVGPECDAGGEGADSRSLPVEGLFKQEILWAAQ